MANTIKHKRGTSTPTASDLVAGELAINTSNGDVFTKTDSNAVVQVGREVVDDTSPQLGGDLASNGNNINLADNDKLLVGTGNDLEIYHDANNASYIRDVGTGNLNIDSTGGNIQIRVSTNEPAITATQDGSVKLYYDSSKKFETGQYGATVTGSLAASNIELEDNGKLLIGTSDDLQIYHDGSNSNIVDTGTGNLILDSNGSGVVIKKFGSSENMAQFLTDGAVELYYDNTKTFETTSTGVEVTAGGILGVKNSGAQSELRLYCESSNAHYASIKAPPHSDFSGNITFTMPATDGNANQVLKTDGAGNLGWVDQSSGGGGSGISRAQATAVTLIFG